MKSPPDAVYAEVRDTDPDALDAAGLTEHDGRLAELRAWIDAEQVRSTRARRRLAERDEAADPASSLARDGKQSSKDAKAAADREEVCTAMPGFEDALSGGSVSAGHVDAVANATRNLDEAEAAEFVGEAESLLADAERQGVNAFARNCRDLAKNIRSRHNSRADLDELEQQRKQSKISRWVDQQTKVEPSGSPPPSSDWRSRRCRRPAHTRIAPSPSTTAASTTSPHGGSVVAPTSRILAPVCEPHHHLIHEGGWALTMTADRIATWTRPDGQTYWTGTLNDRTPIAA